MLLFLLLYYALFLGFQQELPKLHELNLLLHVVADAIGRLSYLPLALNARIVECLLLFEESKFCHDRLQLLLVQVLVHGGMLQVKVITHLAMRFLGVPAKVLLLE